MSSYRDYITTTDSRLREAATRGDKEGAITILDEYWQALQTFGPHAAELKTMLAAAASDPAQPVQLLLTAAALHPDPSFVDEIGALTVTHPDIASVTADIVRHILALQPNPPPA